MPAAGWIKELRADASGLWGRVEWTATAREMIGRKEYRFLAPSFLHNKAGQIMRLKGAGLVHNPNLTLTDLASQEAPMKPIPPDTAEPASLAELAAALAALIGLPPTFGPPRSISKGAIPVLTPPMICAFQNTPAGGADRRAKPPATEKRRAANKTK